MHLGHLTVKHAQQLLTVPYWVWYSGPLTSFKQTHTNLFIFLLKSGVQNWTHYSKSRVEQLFPIIWMQCFYQEPQTAFLAAATL